MTLSSTVAQRLAANLEFDDEQIKEQSAQPVVNSQIVAIAKTLNDNPLLITPATRWLQQKLAEMAGAQLSVLYTPEELDEMRKNV